MLNKVVGTRNGRRTKIDYYLWDEADANNGFPAMERETGFSTAIGALFIGRGRITSKGILPSEAGSNEELYKAFMDELKERNIRVMKQKEVIK